MSAKHCVWVVEIGVLKKKLGSDELAYWEIWTAENTLAEARAAYNRMRNSGSIPKYLRIRKYIPAKASA